uniref:alkyl/aryl-sulfatase n=1 Tax=uncultured Desulfovibrio sp. TaxID=167968 RepID=UPI00260C140E
MKKVMIMALVLALAAGSAARAQGEDRSREASEATKQAQRLVRNSLDFKDMQAYEDAHRGFVAPLPDMGRITDEEGRIVWNLEPYAFLAAGMSMDMPPSRIIPTEGPDTVNPSLWRQSQLVLRDGLYKVTDGLYQVRNADLSNMTIVEGKTGLIVIDPLISAETAAAALRLYRAHRPDKPVVAVIYSHSHVDHFGGALGVVSAEDAASGKVRVIAPAGFMSAAVAENGLAGPAMRRRAAFMYGSLLPAGPRGHVGAGLGLTTSRGTSSLVPPNEVVNHDGQTLTIDGLTFEFQLAPNTEAPAEMHWYIPELKALSVAENCTQTMHNLYTLRGARGRDPLLWADALDESLRRWGDKAEVLYGMHHWPVWGKDRVRTALELGRDVYRYINDQTLRLANKGLGMLEIAEQLRLPPELDKPFAVRGYYGTLNHNVKGVYTYYLGWFDGNAAGLDPLPRVEASRRYVEYMGGAEAVLGRAREDFARGNYRWVAQVLDHVIFAEPENMAARELAADALEQLGYQAESGPWRNFYLSAAQELRGLEPPAMRTDSDGGDLPGLLPPREFFRNLAVRLDGERAAGKDVRFVATFTDTGESWLVDVERSVLHARKVDGNTDPSLMRIKGPQKRLYAILSGAQPLPRRQDVVSVEGTPAPRHAFLALR